VVARLGSQARVDKDNPSEFITGSLLQFVDIMVTAVGSSYTNTGVNMTSRSCVQFSVMSCTYASFALSQDPTFTNMYTIVLSGSDGYIHIK